MASNSFTPASRTPITVSRQSRSSSPLWFDTQGEEAAAFYTSTFDNSRILHVARYGEAGPRRARS